MDIDGEVEIFKFFDLESTSREMSPYRGHECQAIHLLSDYATNLTVVVKWYELAGFSSIRKRTKKQTKFTKLCLSSNSLSRTMNKRRIKVSIIPHQYHFRGITNRPKVNFNFTEEAIQTKFVND